MSFVMISDFCQICVEWLLAYGPIILFLALAFGIIALPIPDDTLLLVAGMLIEQGKLSLYPTAIFAFLGSVFGITVSYLLGRLWGTWILKNWGPKIRLTENRVAKATGWFNRIGKWTLLVCYFLPILRHVAGFVAGSSKLPVYNFMFVAYTGAFIWVTSYLAMGFYLKKLAAHGIKLLF